MFSKSSRNVVNIISAIAVVGVAVGTTAMVVTLSVFNGLDVLIKQFFSVFDPQLKITVVEGKQFDPTTPQFEAIRKDPSVAHFCEVAEEIALLRYEDRQFIATIKGVTDEYFEMNHLDSFMFNGHLLLNDGNFDYTIVGRGVAYNLGASSNFVRPINISIPKKGISNNLLQNPFNSRNIFLSGIYEVGQVEVDDQYALVSLPLARELIGLSNEVTSVELELKAGANTNAVQKHFQGTLGNKFKVQNRYQQHESYYNVAKSEQFFIFLILSFILLIASFNLAGSITMLILDKKKDIQILQSLGLTRDKIGKIFLVEGIMVSLIGDCAGLLLGVLLCLGQMHWGWLKFPGSFTIESYPVDLRPSNLIIIAITVLVIGTAVSWLPVKLLPKRFFEISQD